MICRSLTHHSVGRSKDLPALVGWRRSRGWASAAPASQTSLPDPFGLRPRPPAGLLVQNSQVRPDAVGGWSVLTESDRAI